MRKISDRDIVIALNNGNGLKYLEESFNMSEEVLINNIHLIYGGETKSATKVIRDLKKNDKKTRRKKETDAKTVTTTDKPIVDTEDVKSTVKSVEKHSLDALKRHEGNLSKQVIDLEKKHNELISKRKAEEVKQTKLCDKLTKLRDQFEEASKEFSQSTNKAEEISNQIAQVNVNIAKIKDKLETTRTEIEAMQHVEIYVMKDGKIEVAPGGSININKEEITIEILELGKKYNNLTVSNLQTLYHVINLARNYKDSGRKVEVVFEHKEMEVAFNDYKFQS